MSGGRVRFVLLVLLGVLATVAAHAQSGTIRIIFPYAAGGSGDATARLLADRCKRASDRPCWWRTARAAPAALA
jgi:tripartite-type tricarboxylate transporter receptor subunit TctC